jgi:endonuclease YncB( thermonuclease family)
MRFADQYGRNVSVCSLGSEDLNAWLVSRGLAVAYK